ncbi:trypsin-like peptidase domain-containing protein [Kitasatospora albolonga]|uniref:VMAP-C domain-containing protein n=1 Tax=Kitasatospora albolonga TaxID=68173 RepID=UPI0031E9E110
MGPDGQPVGGGVYLHGRLLLTCAHVVNAALGRGLFEVSDPTATAALRVAFRAGAAAAAPPGSARVEAWLAPRAADGGPAPEGAVEWLGDLAVLRLDADPPPDAFPQSWAAMTVGQQLRAWYGTGQAVSATSTTVQVCEPDRSYVDAAASGPAIGPGYSGGPLWSAADQAVVGLVAGQLRGTGGFGDRSLVLSWQTVRGELEWALGPARAVALLLPAHPAPAAALQDGLPELSDLLGELFPGTTERADGAAHLAALFELGQGPAGTAPSVERMAALLLTEPRALAALAEYRRHSRPDQASRLLGLGHELAVPGLLSPEQYGRLVAMLEKALEPPAPGLPSLARLVAAALPWVDLPPALLTGPVPEGCGSRTAALVRHLETYRPGKLLRFVEYVAAALGTRGETALARRLHTWNENTADRLGVSLDALRDYRADAGDWPGAAAEEGTERGTPRLVVRLTRYQHSGAGRFRCALWADHGDGELHPVDGPGGRPGTPEEVARDLRAVMAEWEDGGEDPYPTVEFVLDKEELGLAVEEWDTAHPEELADGDEPRPLGTVHPVVVRLALDLDPVRSRERAKALAFRWRWRTVSPPLHLDGEHQEPRQVASALLSHRAASCVVLGGPDRERRVLLAVKCLRMGVPVVIWDRVADGSLPAGHFAPIDPGGPEHSLPERVRSYRAGAFGYAERFPLRPVLAREDPTRPLPQTLALTDPEERP